MDLFPLVSVGGDLLWVYDLSVWGPAVQIEDLDQLVLGGGGLGEHAPGLGGPPVEGRSLIIFGLPSTRAISRRYQYGLPLITSCTGSPHL